MPRIQSLDQGKDATPRAWQSVLAGATAGGVESLVTYPTEYVKTRQQLASSFSGRISPAKILVTTLKTSGPRALYSGAGAFCISNASKSSVRFLTFDLARRFTPRDINTGKTTPWGNLLAGMAAGIAESVLVLTPGETLKTKLIEDGGRRYKGSIHAVASILRVGGPKGLYAGVTPVTLKQSSMPWMQHFDMTAAPAISGALAGCATVYTTMPFDNIKTRLQATNGRTRYRGSVHCFMQICQSEGVRALWNGTVPRLIRLSVSGAISFSIYEYVIRWTRKLVEEPGFEGLRPVMA